MKKVKKIMCHMQVDIYQVYELKNGEYVCKEQFIDEGLGFHREWDDENYNVLGPETISLMDNIKELTPILKDPNE